MLKIAEIPGFQTGKMVRMCDSRGTASLSRIINLVFGRLWRKDLQKATSTGCNSRKVLIFSWSGRFGCVAKRLIWEMSDTVGS